MKYDFQQFWNPVHLDFPVTGRSDLQQGLSRLYSPNFQRTCTTLVSSSEMLRVSPCFQTSPCLFGSILRSFGTLSQYRLYKPSGDINWRALCCRCACSFSNLLQNCYKVGPFTKLHIYSQKFFGTWFCQSFCCLGKNRKRVCAKIWAVFSNLLYWEISLKPSKIWEEGKKKINHLYLVHMAKKSLNKSQLGYKSPCLLTDQHQLTSCQMGHKNYSTGLRHTHL